MPPVTVTRSAYGVEAFLCDGSTGTQLQLAPGLPFVQGNLVTLCVQPDADSRADGVVMDRIESFTWNKEQSTITQPAVANGSVHGNGLSVYSCAPDKAYCTISSILSAGFYESAGLVGGIGAAYLGFDNGNNNNNDIGEAEVVQVQPVLRDFLLDLTGGNGRDNNDNDGSGALRSIALHCRDQGPTTRYIYIYIYIVFVLFCLLFVANL